MNKKIAYIIVLLLISIQIFNTYAIQRFPKPEFESGHTQPPTITPNPTAAIWDVIDVFVLFASLTVITWLILKKRDRKGVFWMSIFSILYFGFCREGCVCSVGSLQNITLALFNPDYQIPITVIAFFVLPIIYTLFFGRTFCAGICPLGAIQDIFAIKPMPIKSWLEKVLGIFPFIYLALAVLYAATKTDFIICRYDPFVGFFRFNATFTMFAIGGLLLLIGMFIARPYCRFLCPYGVILNLVSRVSKKHLTITPAECIQCRLCEDSCPFGAIEKPVPAKMKENKDMAIRRFIILAVITPLFMFAGGYAGSQFHENLARVNHTVQLAEEIAKGNTYETEIEPIEITAFKTSGKPIEQLYNEATEIIDEFYIGGWIIGIFIGLVFALTLLSLSVYQYREDYVPNKGRCLSCGRCMDYCPVKQKLD
jgi:NosR/NirI family transcriptional regulator, nitrous oxide reductase regulator